MAENKMFAGAKKVGGRVPKWAWYMIGGVGIAGGIMYFRNRGTVTEPDPGSDTYSDEGVVGYTDASQAPGIIVPPVVGGEAVPAEINTDIPSTTLGIFGEVIGGLTDLLGGYHQDQTELLQALAQAGGSANQQGSNGGGVVTVQGPANPPKAKANPASKLEAGYHAGATVDMGPNARKTFPGAIGWVRIGDGEKGAAHWIDVHVRFCSKLERWRVRPNAKGSPWNKTWSGPRPNICD